MCIFLGRSSNLQERYCRMQFLSTLEKHLNSVFKVAFRIQRDELYLVWVKSTPLYYQVKIGEMQTVFLSVKEYHLTLM